MDLTKGISGFHSNLTFPIPTAPYYLNSLPQVYNKLNGEGHYHLLPNAGFDHNGLFKPIKPELLKSIAESASIDEVSNLVHKFKSNVYNRINDVFNVVFIIGCGGTGGYLVRDLGRYVSTLPYGNKTLVVLIDGDKVEDKNLNRQNFIRKDLGRNKAEVMASRYSNHYGINIVAYPNHLTKDNITNLMGHGGLQKLISTYLTKGINPLGDNLVNLANLCVISCVDNNATRKLLHQYFIGSGQWSNYDIESAMTPLELSSLSWIDSGNVSHSGQVVAYYNTISTPGITGLYSSKYTRATLAYNPTTKTVLGMPHSSIHNSYYKDYQFLRQYINDATLNKIYGNNKNNLPRNNYIKIANPFISGIEFQMDSNLSINTTHLERLSSLLTLNSGEIANNQEQLYSILARGVNDSNLSDRHLYMLRALLLSHFGSSVTRQSLLKDNMPAIFPLANTIADITPDIYEALDDAKDGLNYKLVEYYKSRRDDSDKYPVFEYLPVNLPDYYALNETDTMLKSLFSINHKWEPATDLEAGVKFAYLYNIFNYLGGISTFPVTSFYPDILRDQDERTNLELSCAEQATVDPQTQLVNIQAASQALHYFSQIFAATPAGSFLTSYGVAWNHAEAREIKINLSSIQRVLNQYVSSETKQEVA